jgi:hypothetical protein
LWINRREDLLHESQVLSGIGEDEFFRKRFDNPIGKRRGISGRRLVQLLLGVISNQGLSLSKLGLREAVLHGSAKFLLKYPECRRPL